MRLMIDKGEYLMDCSLSERLKGYEWVGKEERDFQRRWGKVKGERKGCRGLSCGLEKR